MGKEINQDSVILYDAFRQEWLLFRCPLRVHAAYSYETVLPVLKTVEQEASAKGLYAVGFIAYEAGHAFLDPSCAVPSSSGSFPLIWFGIYKKPEKISFPSFLEKSPVKIKWTPSVSGNEYRTCFNKIKEYIRAGDTYQVNYTYRLRTLFSEDPWMFFVRMVNAQGYGYGAFVDTMDWAICSASPELFFSLEGEYLVSKPMKGTSMRGLQQADDLEKAAWLAKSEKNRAENVMITDMVRNDMGRIADVDRVEVSSLFDIEKYPTLWHMTSKVCCQTKADIADIFCALFPAASITGAPKVRTMQIIAELENAPRKIYTGTIGYIFPERRVQFNVAIRTVLLDKRNRTAEYGVGGGIVWDSESADEMQECRTKAGILAQPMPVFELLETILWTPENGYFLLDDHLKRMKDTANYFSCHINIEIILGKLKALETKLSLMPHKIRLMVSQAGEPTLEVHLLSNIRQPYRICVGKQSVDSNNPFLYHKTTYRQVYEQALAESPGYDDVLLWNERGELTESCFANVVAELNGRLLTPPVSSGLLPGTYRSLLIQQGTIEEEIVFIKDLHRYSKVYLINSVRGMWEVLPSNLSI